MSKKEGETIAADPNIVVKEIDIQAFMQKMNMLESLVKSQQQTLDILIERNKELEEDIEEEIQDRQIIQDVLKRQPQFKIQIDEQESTDNNAAVFASVNGYAYLIPRGVEVIVPESILSVLRDAVITTIVKDRDGNETLRKMPRFSVRTVEQVSAGGEG